MRRALGLAVSGLLLCGCALGAEGSAHPIDSGLIPHGLLAPSSSSPVATVAVPTDNVTLYLESAQGLVAVDRAISSPATLRTILSVLARGPTHAESTAGLQSPLSAAAPIALRSLVNGSALVELPSDFTDLGGQDQIFAAAQLVYTATAFPGVDQVSILVNGQLAEVPTANGSLSPGPLRRTDYAALAPR